MISQSVDMPHRSALEADVVVIGAGAAGVAVASRLAAGNLRVIVVEGGGLDPAADRDTAGGRVGGSLPYFDPADCRPRGLSGSTVLWGGWIEPLSDIDFESRRDLTGMTGWCLPRTELEPYYQRARMFCGVPQVTPARVWRRAEEARAFGSPLSPRVFPVLGPRQLGHCHAEIFESGNVDLVLGATVTRIVTSVDGSTVDHLVVGTPDGELRVSADRFVLAVGGIETARLLLASSSTAWPEGLGNGHDLVGRCFMEHPHVDALRLRGDRLALDEQFFTEQPGGENLDGEPMRTCGALVLSDEACRAENVGSVQIFVEPTGEHTHHRLPLQHDGKPFPLRHDQPTDDTDLAVIAVTEQIPNRDSRIVLGESVDRYGMRQPVVQWEMTETDHRTVDVGVAAARDLLQALGAKDFRQRSRHDTWADTVGGPHHLGTARMALSAADGVVDGDCRVHGTTNLFVAGGAVFPTVGYAPPTLTIIALALRLADHLAAAG